MRKHLFDYFSAGNYYKEGIYPVNMAELTYKQKCARHFDQCWTKNELIWKYIELAEAFDALTDERNVLVANLKHIQDMKKQGD